MTGRKTVPVSFRLPAELVEQLDQRATAWRSALPGFTVTRTDMVVLFLRAGLQSAEAEPPRSANAASTELSCPEAETAPSVAGRLE